MSIASELTALNGYILDAYDAINAKSGTIPANKNMANLASAISSISGGGGGDPAVETGTLAIPAGGGELTISHTLGSAPQLFTLHYQKTQSFGPEEVVFWAMSSNGNITASGYYIVSILMGNVSTSKGDSVTDGVNYITMNGSTVILSANIVNKIDAMYRGSDAFWMATTKGELS